MKIVAVLLVALVACCRAGVLFNSPLLYSAVAPAVKNIEIETPVVTKANLKVLTDEDELSTTEIKPLQYAWHGAGAWGPYGLI